MLSRGLPLTKSFFQLVGLHRHDLIKKYPLISFTCEFLKNSTKEKKKLSRLSQLNDLKQKVFRSPFCDLMNPENLFVYSYEKTFSFLINFLSAQLLLAKIWFNNMNISRSWREIKKKNKISRWMFLAFYWIKIHTKNPFFLLEQIDLW